MYGALLASAGYGAEPKEWTAGRISVFVLASGCVPGSARVARCLWPEAKGVCDRGIMPALGVRERRRAIRRDAEWCDRDGRAPRLERSASRVQELRPIGARKHTAQKVRCGEPRQPEGIWLDRRGLCVDKNRLPETGRGEMAEWPKAAVC